jgi:hypothetical protein
MHVGVCRTVEVCSVRGPARVRASRMRWTMGGFYVSSQFGHDTILQLGGEAPERLLSLPATVSLMHTSVESRPTCGVRSGRRERGETVKRILALGVLVLLAMGMVSSAQAQLRIMCPTCSCYNTWAHYHHVNCPNGIPPWPQWDDPAFSDNGQPPPYQSVCAWCQQLVSAEYCRCYNCAKTFWPCFGSACVGGGRPAHTRSAPDRPPAGPTSADAQREAYAENRIRVCSSVLCGGCPTT